MCEVRDRRSRTGQAAPILRDYMREIRVTRRPFEATLDSPDEAIEAELPSHAVLRLAPLG